MQIFKMQLPEASGHDNVLLSYCVDAREKEIRLHTGTYPYENPDIFEDFIFSGVVAYHFECDLFSNIIDDIAEVTRNSSTKITTIYFKSSVLRGVLRAKSCAVEKFRAEATP